jgi:outer membrane protein OmpA-like peptidoglycan-associated protein
MEFSLSDLGGRLTRLGAVIAIAASLGACSVIPEWMGGDPDTTTVSDDSAAPAPDQTQTADANASAADNGQFPDLADTPSRPAAPSTPDDQKKVADSLAADRAQQNYSADALRAGTDTPAAPPGAAPSPDELADVDTGSKSSPSADADSSSDSDADAGSAPTTATASAAPPPSTPAAAPTTAVASNTVPAPSGGLPAVPASTVSGAQSVAMSDAALGFQASKAPPLDASVAQFVPQPIMSRYQQTASLGGAAGVTSGAYNSGPAVPAVPGGQLAMGGPERMTGAVVANYDAFQGGGQPAVAYSNAAGLPPAAIITFPSETTILSADAKAQVQSAAQSFNARGATGYIRVVGHAAVASTKISEERRLQVNFERSQARATAVMRELIKDGVPANKILIDAVGDTQPVYDAAAQGENGNRRAEIFFQG